MSDILDMPTNPTKCDHDQADPCTTMCPAFARRMRLDKLDERVAESARRAAHSCAAILDAHRGERGLLVHQYRACPHSGAGNCCCGRQEEATLHPHRFTLALAARQQGRWFCVCSKREDEPIHRAAS